MKKQENESSIDGPPELIHPYPELVALWYAAKANDAPVHITETSIDDELIEGFMTMMKGIEKSES